jgi:ABC-type nickel/cobalt efflux system permease component RcnA
MLWIIFPRRIENSASPERCAQKWGGTGLWASFGLNDVSPVYRVMGAQTPARRGPAQRRYSHVGAAQTFLNEPSVPNSMAFDLLVFSALALALGVKHAFDVDHVVAISGILTRETRWQRTVTLSASWASGHMITAAVVSAALFFLANTLLRNLLSKMELLVPFMLLAIGLLGLFALARKLHYHRHQHAEAGPKHSHFHLHLKKSHEHGAMAGIGVVHGLASNDELLAVLFVGLAADAWWQVFLGVALFSVGVMAAMAIYSTLLHGVSRRTGARWVPDAATAAFSLASIVYAVYLLAGGKGLNLLQRFFG